MKILYVSTGPGPVYRLPTLTGYIGHDPSRRREPAYSIKSLKRTSMYEGGPGPKYNIGGLTNRGIEKNPAYTIGLKKTRQGMYVFFIDTQSRFIINSIF